MADQSSRPGNIKEGGYQPITDPPAPPSGQVPPQAVNPITGNPNAPSPPTPQGPAGGRTPAPPAPPPSDGA